MCNSTYQAFEMLDFADVVLVLSEEPLGLHSGRSRLSLWKRGLEAAPYQVRSIEGCIRNEAVVSLSQPSIRNFELELSI